MMPVVGKPVNFQMCFFEVVDSIRELKILEVHAEAILLSIGAVDPVPISLLGEEKGRVLMLSATEANVGGAGGGGDAIGTEGDPLVRAADTALYAFNLAPLITLPFKEAIFVSAVLKINDLS
jgi:hypothetical protein